MLGYRAPRSPDAVQRAAVHRRSGAFASSAYELIRSCDGPGSATHHSACAPCCAAPGKRGLLSRPSRSRIIDRLLTGKVDSYSSMKRMSLEAERMSFCRRRDSAAFGNIRPDRSFLQTRNSAAFIGILRSFTTIGSYPIGRKRFLNELTPRLSHFFSVTLRVQTGKARRPDGCVMLYGCSMPCMRIILKFELRRQITAARFICSQWARLIFNEIAIGQARVFRMKFFEPAIFCDEEFASACKSAKLAGVSFMPMNK